MGKDPGGKTGADCLGTRVQPGNSVGQKNQYF